MDHPISFSQSVFCKAIANESERTAWASQLVTLYRHMKKTDPAMQMLVSARCNSLETQYPVEYCISFTRDKK